MLLSDKYQFLTNYFTEALNIKNRAFPQSLLFYGNDFDAQYTLANEIARLLNCKFNKNDDCQCLNCKWIREHSHPAVLTISRLDNKPEDDDSKTVISIKQSQMIKEMLLSDSEFHRVFIFCDKDDNEKILGLNQFNFQAETANSLLKIIEEPQPRITFIFLTRYVEDLLSTIVSRSQCFFVPSFKKAKSDYDCIEGIFTNYYNFERQNLFQISQKLNDLTKEYTAAEILEGIQNYILELLKANPSNGKFLKDIHYVEEAMLQLRIGIKTVNIFDNLCLKIID